MIKFSVFTISALLLANVANAAPKYNQDKINNAKPEMVNHPMVSDGGAQSPASTSTPVAAPALSAKPANVPVHQEDNNISDTEVNLDKKDEYQQVIDDYRAYLTTVSKDTMEEIRAYRIEVVKINKKKKALYKSLSQEAQKYLAQEAAMKRKLPVNKRKFSE